MSLECARISKILILGPRNGHFWPLVGVSTFRKSSETNILQIFRLKITQNPPKWIQNVPEFYKTHSRFILGGVEHRDRRWGRAAKKYCSFEVENPKISFYVILRVFEQFWWLISIETHGIRQKMTVLEKNLNFRGHQGPKRGQNEQKSQKSWFTIFDPFWPPVTPKNHVFP